MKINNNNILILKETTILKKNRKTFKLKKLVKLESTI